MNEVSRILSAMEAGNPQAAEKLVPLVYEELRKLAGRHLANESPGHTLNATALVHEAYLRLTGEEAFTGKTHYLRAAAQAMRRILIDHARGRAADKRGGGLRRVPLDNAARWVESPDHLLALDDALRRFALEEPSKAELVELRFFAGMTTTEAASVLGISVATAERWWTYARAWLLADLGEKK
jgi:RNA polymerase sigma factor (TIGR02999 family)